MCKGPGHRAASVPRQQGPPAPVIESGEPAESRGGWASGYCFLPAGSLLCYVQPGSITWSGACHSHVHGPICSSAPTKHRMVTRAANGATFTVCGCSVRTAHGHRASAKSSGTAPRRKKYLLSVTPFLLPTLKAPLLPSLWLMLPLEDALLACSHFGCISSNPCSGPQAFRKLLGCQHLSGQRSLQASQHQAV